MPTAESESLPHMDKVMHFMAYGIIAGGTVLSGLRWRAGIVVAVVTGWGVWIEILQNAMPHLGRTGSWPDALANMAGAVCAVGLLLVLNTWLKWRLFPTYASDAQIDSK